MTAVERLEQDVAALSPEDLAEFRDWFVERDSSARNRNVEHDAAGGQRDRLPAEARATRAGKKPYTAVITQRDSGWIGWIEEVPGVNCQERSREALLESLRITLVEAIEMNRDEARGAAGTGFEELSISI